MEPVAKHADGATVRVRVVPGASRTEVKGRYGDAIKIRVAAPPEGGRANQAVVTLLNDLIGGRAEIITGRSSQMKTILIRGIEPAAIVEVLEG